MKSSFVSERENVDEDICELGQGVHAVEVDLMQPLDPEKKPAVHTTPLNHVGLWVDDLPKAVEWMAANGVRFAPGGIRKGAAGHDICFIHPKASDDFPHRRRRRVDRAGAGAARGGGRTDLRGLQRLSRCRLMLRALPYNPGEDHDLLGSR